MTRGVIDGDIQLDLLSDKNQNMTLEEVFQFIEAKEAGKRLVGHLIDSQGLDASRNSYRRTKSEETPSRNSYRRTKSEETPSRNSLVDETT